MQKNHILATLIIGISIACISFVNASNNHSQLVAASKDSVITDSSSVQRNFGDIIYDSLKLTDTGLSKETVEYAVKGYQKLADSGLVNNPYLTIVDLSQSSRKKRFYILDMKNDKLVWNTFVAHGRNSGVDEATRFSNQPNSNESSLGFYLTKDTYRGKHGLSLRVRGLEDGFNDNAEARGIVVHGAPYVNAARVSSAYMGRSQGCPALPVNEYAKVIDIIKGGSVMFVYSPSIDYLQQSPLLN